MFGDGNIAELASPHRFVFTKHFAYARMKFFVNTAKIDDVRRDRLFVVLHMTVAGVREIFIDELGVVSTKVCLLYTSDAADD